MIHIIAFYGSPRRQGNTAALLRQAVAGARASGARVTEIVLRDLKMSPCLEIYGCKKDGRCVIKDDFQQVHDQLQQAQGFMVASPIFYYAVSAHLKTLMDRCNAFWVKKYWIDKVPFNHQAPYTRQALFIACGATGGKKLFDGALLSVKYFLDALDSGLWKALLYRYLDYAEDIHKHPEYLQEAYDAGSGLVRALAESGQR